MFRKSGNVDKVFKQIRFGRQLPYDQIDNWVARQKFDEITQLAKEIVDNWDSGPSQNWRYDGGFTRIVEGLALTEGKSYIETLFTVLNFSKQVKIATSKIATQLVSKQPISLLDDYAKTSDPELLELWACVIQEIVLKNEDVRRFPNLIAIWDKLTIQQHPLTLLPLKLMQPESEVHIYQHFQSVGGSGGSMPFGPTVRKSDEWITIPTLDKSIHFSEIDDPEYFAEMSRAVDNWEQESNGRYVTQQFVTQRPIDERTLSESNLLLKLGLRCLPKLSSGNVYVRPVNSQRVINLLFSAAANGGAYNRGSGNAYGRLHAWQSVRSLMKLTKDTPIHALEEHMAKCIWMTFESDSNWFYQVAWDFGIIAISEDRHTISVLASTDTD